MTEHDEVLTTQYFQARDIVRRNAILKQLALFPPVDGKTFFLAAFRKERCLDMKLIAVRGYAACASEEEVAPLMDKLFELLKKRASATPYNYQEYEVMRSAFLMPYLVDRYGYACFRRFAKELEARYTAMPDCFKDIFTLDEEGHAHNVRDPGEVSQSIQAFLSSPGD